MDLPKPHQLFTKVILHIWVPTDASVYVNYCTTVRIWWSSALFSRSPSQPCALGWPVPWFFLSTILTNQHILWCLMWKITENRVALGEKRENRRWRDGKRTSMQPRPCMPHTVTAKKPETLKSSASILKNYFKKRTHLEKIVIFLKSLFTER